ncbi:MAG: NAD(P)H-dependent oxidoreductase [Coriobacteriia bacterium]|nr:NAD(P)H-dependent oxidoreductase [Coriobacteriia bacterium]
MNYLFINGSANANGNTAALAAEVLAGRGYETVELGTTKVYDYGQQFADDEFESVLAKMNEADTIVMGSPVYWHDLSGMLRNLLDRCYGPVPMGGFQGKRLAVVFQGSAPTRDMIARAEYTMSRFAGYYGMEYLGLASDAREAKKLAKRL